MSRPRLLAASLEPLLNYKDEPTRTSGLFVELERLFPLAGFVRPTIRGPGDWAAKARAFHPNRDAWRGRAWLSPLAFRLQCTRPSSPTRVSTSSLYNSFTFSRRIRSIVCCGSPFR